MRYYAIRRNDGKFFCERLAVMSSGIEPWVMTASRATLYWGHDGERVVGPLHLQNVTCELVPVDITVRSTKDNGRKPHAANTNGTVRSRAVKKAWSCIHCSVDPTSPGHPGTDVRGEGSDMFCNGCGGHDLALL